MNEEKIITVGLTIGEWDIIVASLSEMPYKFAHHIIDKIIPTVKEQYENLDNK